MENPNVTTVRRHNSLQPPKCSSYFMLRMSCKSNPYVGTFRHSPPTTTRISALSRGSSINTTTTSWKNSVVMMRSSTTSLKDLKNAWHRSLPEDLCRYLVYEASLSRPRKVGNDGLYMLQDLLNGRLRGGSDDDYLIDWGHFQRTLQRQSHHSSSGTIQVLSRLAYWLIRPFQDPTSTPKKSSMYDYGDDGSSSMTTDYPYYYDDSVGGDGDDDDDDNSTICSIPDAHSPTTTSQVWGSSSVISSQAEAYYAHQATHSSMSKLHHHHSSSAGSHSDVLDPTPADYRLDYTITQMDVLRMMRNASRHLDVESIVQLPVYTYQKQGPSSQQRQQQKEHERTKQQQQEMRDDSDPDMSWLLVPDKEEENDQAKNNSDHDRRSDNNGKKNVDDDDERDTCVICLEHFNYGDRLRVLPCDHSFHVGCIDRWLSGSHSFDDCITTGCPTCKKHATVQGEADQGQRHHHQQHHYCDGSVPSWAFARIGDALARSSSMST